MKTSTIVAIILATGAVVLATLALISKKKKHAAANECGCDLEHTDACCCTDSDCCDDLDDICCGDSCDCTPAVDEETEAE